MVSMEDAAPSLRDTAAAIEFSIPADHRRLVWRELFPREAPIEVDLGCGDGSFLAGISEQNPARNFLGIDRMIGRVRSACRKIASRGLTNARVVRTDIPHAVQHLLPPGSVDVCHLLFPDPWPKRRHHRRRVMTAEFLQAVGVALVPGGFFRIATDQADYFSAIVRVARETSAFQEFMDSAPDSPLPVTTFEQRFRSAGEEIHRLVLRKVSG